MGLMKKYKKRNRYKAAYNGVLCLARPAGVEPATYGLEVRCSVL